MQQHINFHSLQKPKLSHKQRQPFQVHHTTKKSSNQWSIHVQVNAHRDQRIDIWTREQYAGRFWKENESEWDRVRALVFVCLQRNLMYFNFWWTSPPERQISSNCTIPYAHWAAPLATIDTKRLNMCDTIFVHMPDIDTIFVFLYVCCQIRVVTLPSRNYTRGVDWSFFWGGIFVSFDNRLNK